MMPVTTGISEVELLLANLLKGCSNNGETPVLNERSPGDRPKNAPYVTFLIYWNEGNAYVYKKTISDDATDEMAQVVHDDCYFTARIQCIGKDAFARANSIRMTLNSDTIDVVRMRDYIGICDIDDIQSVPDQNTDGTVRERAYFNFKFYANVSQTFALDWFNKVDVITSVPPLDFTETVEVIAGE